MLSHICIQRNTGTEIKNVMDGVEVEQKTCANCKVSKELSMFGKRRGGKYIRSWCKECIKAKDQIRYAQNKDVILQQQKDKRREKREAKEAAKPPPDTREKICTNCFVSKSYSDYQKRDTMPDGLQAQCSSCMNAKARARRELKKQQPAKLPDPKRQEYLKMLRNTYTKAERQLITKFKYRYNTNVTNFPVWWIKHEPADGESHYEFRMLPGFEDYELPCELQALNWDLLFPERSGRAEEHPQQE